MSFPETIDGLGGYPQEAFVDQNANALADFECPICIRVLRDPKQCKNGHVFCCRCIQQSLLKNDKCPLCNCFMDSDNFISVCVFMKDILEKKEMFCSVFSCKWKGPLHEFSQHFTLCYSSASCCSIRNCDWKCLNNERFERNHEVHLYVIHKLEHTHKFRMKRLRDYRIATKATRPNKKAAPTATVQQVQDYDDETTDHLLFLIEHAEEITATHAAEITAQV